MALGIWKSLLFLLLQLVWVSGNSSGRLHLEKQILQKMFMASKFHMYVRPDKNKNQETEPLEVFVSLYIINIDVDIKKQECTLQMYFRQEWTDSRLSYDDQAFIFTMMAFHVIFQTILIHFEWSKQLPSVVEKPLRFIRWRPLLIRICTSYQSKIHVLSLHDAVGLWTPDLFFVNEKLGNLHTVTKPNVFVRIHSEGKVLFSQRVTVKFACPMDFRKYPFDVQICTLPIESYGYTANDIMLRWKPDITFGIIEPLDYQVSYSTTENIILLGLNNYSRIELGIHFRRLIHSHLIHVYIPLTLLVAASWISFFLRPSDRIARLSTILTIAFTSLVFAQSIKEFLLPMCYLTGLDVWVGFSCLLVFAAVFENIYVISCHVDKAMTFQTDKISNKKDVPELPNENKDKRKVIDILVGKLYDSNVDAIAKMTFPSVFVLFNIIYLAYYLI